jgi:DNA-binding NarL/FixJ family response regulator
VIRRSPSHDEPPRVADLLQQASASERNHTSTPGIPTRPLLTPATWLRLQGLTPREVEATLRVAKGNLVREIAGDMHVSEGTIKTLLSRARQKLDCHTLRELAAKVLRESGFSAEEILGRVIAPSVQPNGENWMKVDKKYPKG